MHKESIEVEFMVPDGFRAIGWRQVERGELYLTNYDDYNSIPERWNNSAKSVSKYLVVENIARKKK